MHSKLRLLFSSHVKISVCSCPSRLRIFSIFMAERGEEVVPPYGELRKVLLGAEIGKGRPREAPYSGEKEARAGARGPC